MDSAVIASLITGGLSLIGVIIANILQSRKMDARLQTQQAVMDTKLDELTREVRAHNNFAERIPVLDEKISVANHRIKNLEDRADKCITP